MLQPAGRGMLGRPQMFEDRRHVREGVDEVGPAGNAYQAHGAPIDEDREQRQEILDLGPLEQTAQKQDRYAEPFEVLPDCRKLLIAGAEDRLVTVGVALADEASSIASARATCCCSARCTVRNSGFYVHCCRAPRRDRCPRRPRAS